jgi:hypothetical protein
MDHLDAENMKAVERYLLGDLSVSEVEDFERHFFDCPQCSEELRALTIFQENARAVFIEQNAAPVPPKAQAPGWSSGFSWAMALGALAIGIFAGYLAFPSRDGAQAVGAYPLFAQARGEETMVSPAEGSKFYTLYFDKSWDGSYPSYRAVVRDASGKDRLSLPVAPSETFHLLIPKDNLPSGKYVLVMFGSGADKENEVAHLPFTLQIK